MKDNEYINKDNITFFANTNESVLKLPIKGICLEFPGLGVGSCLGGCLQNADYNYGFGEALAKEGILLAYVFSGPWSWMNKGAVRIADLIVDAIKEKYDLKNDCPIVVTGGSMGGLGALVYCASTKHKISSCLSVCPCVDVKDRLYASEEFPRTFLVAVASYDLPFDKALKTISPIERIYDMPDIPYYIVNDCEDEVFPSEQLDEYVEKLKQSHSVNYVRLEGCKHGEISDRERKNIYQFIYRCILNN